MTEAEPEPGPYPSLLQLWEQEHTSIFMGGQELAALLEPELCCAQVSSELLLCGTPSLEIRAFKYALSEVKDE